MKGFALSEKAIAGSMVACVLSASLVASFPVRVVHADEAPVGPTPPTPVKKTPNQEKAEQHYKRARELYQLGRYREAITHLQLAIKLDPSGAELYYNLGLVHEKLGEVDEAVDAYHKYLKVLGPDAEPEEISRIKGIVKRLEGAKAEIKAREAKKVEHRLTPLSGGLLVGAGVFLVGTGVFGGLALAHDREARDYLVDGPGGLKARQKLVDRSKGEALIANVLAALGVASLGAGLTLYFTSEFQKADDPNDVQKPKAARSPSLVTDLRVSVLPLPSGGAMSVQVNF
ncbi:MAG: tetratricopeptide repeat protein [Myxococcales bacterium]|nr:tetratricopeptide repeat protein [Myxococcales bacterium]